MTVNNQNTEAKSEDRDKDKKKTYHIEKQKFETTEEELSVRFLLVDQAKEDPATSTLALKKGNDTHKYKNLDELIPIENGMKFVVFHNEPTTVS